MTNSHTRKGLIFFTISAKIALFTCALPMMYVLGTDIKYIATDIKTDIEYIMKFHFRIFKDPGHFYISMKSREDSWLFMDQVLKLP